MEINMSFTIVGTGSAVPKKIVTNDMLAEFLDTSDEWISERTGIRQRRVLTEETLLSLAAEAGKRALEDAGLNADDIDAVVCGTLQGDFVSPAFSCLIAKEIGIKTGRMIDVNMGCCGFIFALDAAESYIESGKAETVLVVCAEQISKIADWTDRSTCVLFGDGAGAAVVKKSSSKSDFALTVDGNYEPLYVPGRQGNSPYKAGGFDSEYLSMNGQEIFKFAVSSITSDIRAMLKNNSLAPDDVSYYVLHQANLRIINFARQRLGLSEEKVPHNVENYGNTSSASIAIMLDELNKSAKLKKGDKVILCAFGAGLARGCCLFEWGK